MLIDARNLADGRVLEAQVAIVGGGVAGIALALEFDRWNIPVCLLEGGGKSHSAASQGLYAGETFGAIPYSLHRTRSRYLGGSSNCWCGLCRPFGEMDFAQRDWVPHSGWPIPETALRSHYARARDILEIANLSFDPDFWIARVPARGIRRMPFDRDLLDTVVAHCSPPARVGLSRKAELASSANITAILHATVARIDTDAFGHAATGVSVLTPAGGHVCVKASCVILAAGGIENARLLLLSNEVHKAGLGNHHDVVGRYFMDHPRMRLGTLRLDDAHAYSRFYDATYHRGNDDFAVDGTGASATLGLTPALQRREGLMQCHTALFGSYLAENWPGIEAWRQVYSAFKHAEPFNPLVVARMPPGLPAALAHLLARASRMRTLVRHYTLESIIEPVPDPDSRVTLSQQRDAFGMPRVRLEWRVGELEKRTHRRAVELIRDQVESARIGRLTIEANAWDENWQRSVQPTCHHMGTTRMHPDPRLGVVDTDCKVHGVGNLYVAGSSVFPTGAANMPTFTIVALAARLAAHLRGRFQHSPEREEPATVCSAEAA